ncbi:hypothetical protein CHARACLAT_007376 [Characodon lateralis]|uniref:Uncharacterized protein n=1 Tax=Characodon lateralis TaxID=208331 RepID=A0ABU7DEH2_9TELE|nr:hypothetical protein [Characodon lateralis]
MQKNTRNREAFQELYFQDQVLETESAERLQGNGRRLRRPSRWCAGIDFQDPILLMERKPDDKGTGGAENPDGGDGVEEG